MMHPSMEFMIRLATKDLDGRFLKQLVTTAQRALKTGSRIV
jgi:hypothetical protein